MRTRAPLAGVALLVACTSPAPSAIDGGTDALVAVPAPPVLTPCPSGWREVSVDGVTACDPWPSSGPRSDCAFDEAHLPGTPDCARIGPTCPGDGWPSSLPSGVAIVYVDASAVAGGDGASRDHPLRSIADATIALAAHGVIAVRAGRYDEELTLTDGQSLIGACVDGTRLTRTVASAHAAVVYTHGDVRVASLSIDSPERGGIGVIDGALHLEDVVIAGARAAAVVLVGGTLDASRIAIVGTRTETDGSLGRALDVHGTSSASVGESVLQGSVEVGAIVSGAAASLSLSDVAILDTALTPSAAAHEAVGVTAMAHATLTRVAIERATADALSISGGGTLDGSDVVIRDVRPAANGVGGYALQIDDVGTVTVSRLWAVRTHDVALSVHGGTARFDDVIVSDVLPSPALGEGVGAYAIGGATTIARGSFARCIGTAVFATFGASLDARDVWIRDVDSTASSSMGPGGELGDGVWASARATLTITDARVERTRFAGLGSVDATFTATRVAIADVQPSACAAAHDCAHGLEGGFGIVAHDGASMSARAFTVESAALCGVVVGADGPMGATALDLADGVVAHAPVGACVQAVGFDVERLHVDVAYEDIGVPLQATSYPLPTDG